MGFAALNAILRIRAGAGQTNKILNTLFEHPHQPDRKKSNLNGALTPITHSAARIDLPIFGASGKIVFIMLNSKVKSLATSRLVSRERYWTGDL